MKGKQIYFTHQEIIALYLTIEDFEEKASETVYAQRLQNGLGTAWHKLKDCIDSRELEKPINNDLWGIIFNAVMMNDREIRYKILQDE